MSFAMEVQADNTGTWAGNACRYATREESDSAGHELASRWFAVHEWRTVESSDVVNYRFDMETYRSVPLAR